MLFAWQLLSSGIFGCDGGRRAEGHQMQQITTSATWRSPAANRRHHSEVRPSWTQRTVRSGLAGQVWESTSFPPCPSARLSQGAFKNRDSSWTPHQLRRDQHRGNKRWDLLPTTIPHPSPSPAQPWAPPVLFLPSRVNYLSGRMRLARRRCYRVLGLRMGIRLRNGELRFSKGDVGLCRLHR